MDYSLLLEQVKQYIGNFFKEHKDDNIVYHNVDHTHDVVAFSKKLAGHYNLNEQDTFIVTTAAWFHDVGYYTGTISGHERRSADEATTFLENNNVEIDIIGKVVNCIIATSMPQSPHNLLEQIVCDADLAHLGEDDFMQRNKLLRKELELTMNKNITKQSWRKGSVIFLEQYKYHTDYGKTILEAGKQKNIEKLKEKIGTDDASAEKNKMNENTTNIAATNVIAGDDGKTKKKVKEKGTDRPDKGIETMFRISSSNHQRLSDMADNKAHIMITTTSIIISVLLSILLRKLEENRYLTIPVILLLAVCVITMVFCILATRPSIPPGTFTQKDIDDKKVNLLFFGNFYKMHLKEYAEGMNKMMNDREFLYGSLTTDVYSQGVVLGKKYSLLRIGYSVFMYGIVASVLAFLIATLFFK